MIYQSIYETIGNTPIIKLKNQFEDQADVYIKVESFNPGSSIKDRAAKSMILELMKKDMITKDTTIVEATSGNTGIAIAMICSALNLKFIATMPSSMSIERQQILKAYGATVVLTDAKLGMQGSIDEMNQLLEKPNHISLGQFDSPFNPLAHELTTAKEIIDDFQTLDAFVSGIGTGGTISGCAKALKNHYKNIQIIGVEPFDSPFITQGKKGPHKIQGIGAGFIPKNLNLELIDEVLTVTNEEAFECARKIAKENGILVGISSGAAYKAATVIAKKLKKGKSVLFIAADSGERYLSTDLFKE